METICSFPNNKENTRRGFEIDIFSKILYGSIFVTFKGKIIKFETPCTALNNFLTSDMTFTDILDE